MKTVNAYKVPLAALVAAFSLVPGAFAEDAYIQSDGGQAINTGYYVTPKTRVEIDFQMTALANQVRLFGTVNTDAAKTLGVNSMQAYIGNDGTKFNVGFGEESWSTGVSGYNLATADTARHVIVTDNKNVCAAFITGGQTNATVTTKATSVTSTFPMAVFGVMVNAKGNWAQSRPSMKLYGLKIYEDDVLVRDFMPAICDGAAGLWERINKRFFVAYSPDSMTFASGGDIETIKGEPYIESDGTCIMNTRHFASPTTKVEVDYAFLATNTSCKVFGVNQGGCGLRMAVYETSGLSMGYLYGDTQKTVWIKDSSKNNIPADLYRHSVTLDFANRSFSYCTGESVTYSDTIDAKMAETNITQTAAHPLGLFGGAKDATGTVGESLSKMRVYSCRIWEGGVLKHDYRPLVKGGVVGFKDQVDGYFITGENVSAFTAGGDVEEVADDGYISTPRNNNTVGLCGIDTGYTVGPNTKVLLDYAFLANGSEMSSWWDLFDAYAKDTAERFMIYASSGDQTLHYALGANQQKETSVSVATAKDMRRQVTLDAFNKKVVIATGNFTNKCLTAASGMTGNATSTLRIGVNYAGTSSASAMKIYGFKIYESDELVYDYKPYVKDGVPGLYDSAKDSFVTCPTDLCKQFEAGGDIGGLVTDAYLESDGTGLINSGYKTTANSKIVVDFMLRTTNQQARVLSAEPGTGKLRTTLYVSGGNTYSMGILDVGSAKDYATASKKIDMYRHTATLDAYGRKYSLTGGGLNWSATSTNAMKTASDRNCALFGQAKDTTWSKGSSLCAARIYSVKIYDSGTLVHQFLPYKNGTTVGLKDTVTGNVLTDFNGSTTAFTLNGAGSNGSKELVVAPKDTEVRVEKSATLSAFAAGATSYVWTVDGETSATTGDALTIPPNGAGTMLAYAPGAQSYVWTVDGVEQATTTETLTVPWRKGVKTTEVTCTPVFSIDGVTVKGTTSATTVTYTPRGMVLLFR